MNKEGLGVFVLLHMDAFGSEYIAPCDERIAYLTGFTGSNAIVVVTEREARLWTDGRYYVQAKQELFEGWTMCKMERGHQQWKDYVLKQKGKL